MNTKAGQDFMLPRSHKSIITICTINVQIFWLIDISGRENAVSEPSLMIYTFCQPWEITRADTDHFLGPTNPCLKEDVHRSKYLPSCPPELAFSVYADICRTTKCVHTQLRRGLQPQTFLPGSWMTLENQHPLPDPPALANWQSKTDLLHQALVIRLLNWYLRWIPQSLKEAQINLTEKSGMMQSEMILMLGRCSKFIVTISCGLMFSLPIILPYDKERV